MTALPKKEGIFNSCTNTHCLTTPKFGNSGKIAGSSLPPRHRREDTDGIALGERTVELTDLFAIHQHHLGHLCGDLEMMDERFNGGSFVQRNLRLAAGGAGRKKLAEVGKEFDFDLHDVPFGE